MRKLTILAIVALGCLLAGPSLATDGSKVVPLIAGQNMEVGEVIVLHHPGTDGKAPHIHIKYNVFEPWKIKAVHFDRQIYKKDFPLTPTCNPKVGLFMGNFEFDKPVTYFKSDPIYFECGELFIGAHAEVFKMEYGKKIEETAWAADCEFDVNEYPICSDAKRFRDICYDPPGRGSWATFFKFEKPCPITEP